MSAHWESAPLAISNPVAGTPLYYDFDGFDPHYSTLPYATPDATALARRVIGAAADTTEVHQHPDRGLDHGAFIPLMAMYSAADVPVVQLSMPSLDPKALFDLGKRLQPLREEGILVIGSGFMTHSFEAARNPALAGHTRAFDAWAADALDRGDVDALLDYRRKAPSADIAHPTADHFVPLLLTLGAAGDPGATVITRVERMFGNNSTRSVQLA
ncbi:class III extradiol ring-cleavage dioxygenase [Amycolatopsis rhabdoformis]|uniref:Class III extradiol ring-cleavage dioxygenase n=1 Tax=Amycolatopsis rhabdoformis TaxID=1448059 RepID=A0ABZ1IJG5_9PSEU|nr:class III extradiol ring-cleavage dioxygenase [Amycolatopsis rhabdoformis]WSE34112.1 class III extradiol ring-cleavage dioxygenase [Amycolatopsis rhabdoformis]